jgi:hypothetical protein
MQRRDFDPDEPAAKTIFLDRLLVAANDRDLRLELGIVGNFGRRRLGFRQGLEHRGRRCVRGKCVSRCRECQHEQRRRQRDAYSL